MLTCALDVLTRQGLKPCLELAWTLETFLPQLHRKSGAWAVGAVTQGPEDAFEGPGSVTIVHDLQVGLSAPGWYKMLSLSHGTI